MNYDELKQYITSPEWVTIAKKYNTLQFSFFSEAMNNDLQTLKYEIGKSYFFDDELYNFKTAVSLESGKKVFTLFGKLKNCPIKKTTPMKLPAGFTFSTKMDTNTKLIIISLVVVLLGLIFLSGPIFKVLGW